MPPAADPTNRRGGSGAGAGAAANANAGAGAAAATSSTSQLMSAPGMARPWFLGAPVTKLLFFLVLLSYVALHSHHWNQSTVVLAMAPALRQLTYPNLSELIVSGSLAVLWSRALERTMGSRQLLRLLGVVAIVSFWTRQLSQLVQFREFVGHGGDVVDVENRHQNVKDHRDPLVLSYRYVDLYMGALFWFYHRYTPRLHPRFLNVRGTSRLHGSEKSLYYAWFLYSVVVAARGSVSPSSSSDATVVPPRLAALCTGILSGALFPMLSRFAVIPDRLASAVSSRIGTLLQPPPRMYVPTFGGGMGVGFAGQHGHYRPNPIAHRAAAAAAAAFAPVPRPTRSSPAATATESANVVVADPGAVETLVGMGFDRPQVEQALRATRNDVQGAANLLLASA